MTIRFFLTLATASLLFLPHFAHAQQTPPPGDTLHLSLQEAIERSIERSPEVGVEASERDYAQARYSEARASRFLTEFDATTAHAIAPGLTGMDPETDPDRLFLDPNVRNDWSDLRPFNRIEVAALQPIYTWGQLGGNIRAARHGVGVESAEMRSKELEVAMRTGEVYYNVLLTRTLDFITDEAEETLDRAQRELDRLMDEGDPSVSEADIFQLQIAEQEFNRQVAEVREQRALAQSGLGRQLFLDEGAIALPEEKTLEPISMTLEPLDSYIELGLQHRPEIEQARSGRAAREALVDVARSDYYPKLFMAVSSSFSYAEGRHRQANPYVGDPFRSRGFRLGFGLRQELNFGQTRARVRQAQAELNEVRYQQEGATQLVKFEVEEAYRQLSIRKAAMESRQESLRLSGEWLRTEQINFDLDVGEPRDLIDAVQSNLELRAAYNEAVRDYNIAVLRLLKKTGVLNNPHQAGTLVDF